MPSEKQSGAVAEKVRLFFLMKSMQGFSSAAPKIQIDEWAAFASERSASAAFLMGGSVGWQRS